MTPDLADDVDNATWAGPLGSVTLDGNHKGHGKHDHSSGSKGKSGGHHGKR